MAKPTTVKCRCCNTEIDKSTAYNPAPKSYYCNIDCYNKKEEEKAEKIRKIEENKAIREAKKKSKPKKIADPKRQELMDKLAQIYGDKLNYGFMCTQIKYLATTMNYTYSGIILTLDYVQNILGQQINTDYGISNVITRYYNDAKKYWIKKQRIKKKINEFDFDSKVNVVVVKDRNNRLKDRLKTEEF